MSIVSTPSFSTVHPSLAVTLMLNARISLFESHKRLMRNYKERTLCLGARGRSGEYHPFLREPCSTCACSEQEGRPAAEAPALGDPRACGRRPRAARLR